jgi:hypothetical protein
MNRMSDLIFWDMEELKINARSLALAEKWAQTSGRPECPVCGGYTLVGHMTCGLVAQNER